jgi:hypothetical protein
MTDPKSYGSEEEFWAVNDVLRWEKGGGEGRGSPHHHLQIQGSRFEGLRGRLKWRYWSCHEALRITKLSCTSSAEAVIFCLGRY